MHTNKSLFNYYVIYVGEGGGIWKKRPVYSQISRVQIWWFCSSWRSWWLEQLKIPANSQYIVNMKNIERLLNILR